MFTLNNIRRRNRYVIVRTLATLLIIILVSSLSFVHATTFDCSKVNAPLETAICNTLRLLEADNFLEPAYQAVLAQASPEAAVVIEATQREWFEAMRVEALTHDPYPGVDEGLVAAFYEARQQDLSRMLQARGPFKFYMTDRQLAVRVPPTGQAYQVFEAKISYPQIEQPVTEAQKAWNRLIAIPLDAVPTCAGRPYLFYRNTNVYWATSQIIYTEDSSSSVCNKNGAISRPEAMPRIYVLNPEPHLLKTDDIFVPGTPWRTLIVGEVLGNFKPSPELKRHFKSSVQMRRWLRKAAVSPDRWTLLYDGIHIGLDPAKSYYAGIDDSAQQSVLVAWGDLRSMLRPGMIPPSQEADAFCCNSSGPQKLSWH